MTGPEFGRGAPRLLVLSEKSSRDLAGFGSDLTRITPFPDGRLIAIRIDGSILVGEPGAGPKSLFLGHRSMAGVEPINDQRFVSVGLDTQVRIWDLPDPSQTPLQALPYDQLLSRLRALTNYRVVPDEAAPMGYRPGLLGRPKMAGTFWSESDDI